MPHGSALDPRTTPKTGKEADVRLPDRRLDDRRNLRAVTRDRSEVIEGMIATPGGVESHEGRAS